MVTSVRKKGYFASMDCVKNIKNMNWITENYNFLNAGDHSLIIEYGPVQLKQSSINYVYNFLKKW